MAIRRRQFIQRRAERSNGLDELGIRPCHVAMAGSERAAPVIGGRLRMDLSPLRCVRKHLVVAHARRQHIPLQIPPELRVNGARVQVIRARLDQNARPGGC